MLVRWNLQRARSALEILNDGDPPLFVEAVQLLVDHPTRHNRTILVGAFELVQLPRQIEIALALSKADQAEKEADQDTAFGHAVRAEAAGNATMDQERLLKEAK